jgi:16S rRNA (guanine527-N7)-methyltransferase
VAARCAAVDIERLERFSSALTAESQKHNLISRGSVETMWQRHIADSAQLLDHVPRETSGLWMDLGSGAGFPGVVIAIMRPEQRCILVESRNLRIQWLNRMIDTLEIANCSVVGEDVRRMETIEASIISARAFAPLARLIGQSARFSTTATRWVLPKGQSAAQEVAMLPPRQRSMFHVKQSVTDEGAGIVVGTGQVASTV